MTAVAQPRGPDEHKRLARVLGLRSAQDLIVGTPQNDPFYCGMPYQVRDGEWFAALWERCGFHQPVHCRRVHYTALSLGVLLPPRVDRRTRPVPPRPYENTATDWAFLMKASKFARDLLLVDPRMLVDERTDPPRLHVAPRQRPVEPAADVGQFTLDLDDVDDLDLPGEPDFDLDAVWDGAWRTVPQVDGYDYEPDDQPYLLEVWVEKSTQNDWLVPLCAELGVNLVSGAGYQSKVTVPDFMGRAERHGKPARIFYIQDFDAAGTLMAQSVARHIQYQRETRWPQLDVALDVVLLTPDQVRCYDLPTTPVDPSDHKAAARFIERYGAGSAELDALRVFHPDVPPQIVRAAVEPYLDPTLPDRLDDTKQEAQQVAREAWQDATADVREQLTTLAADVGAVYGRYRPQLDALRSAMDADLAPHRTRLDELRRDVVSHATRFDPELPDRPNPQVIPPDEHGWLYRSDRCWLDQLTRFKAGMPDGDDDDGSGL